MSKDKNILPGSAKSVHIEGSGSSDSQELNGPNFEGQTNAHMDNAKKKGWGGKLKSFFSSNKYKVLAAVVVTIAVVSGILVAATLDESGTQDASLGVANVEEGATGEDTSATEGTGTDDAAGSGEGSESSPALTQEGDTTIVSTEAGEGVTHLARRALANYLEQSGDSLNAEQKVYAEDYLQNQKGSQMLAVGEEIEFTQAELQEAYDEASSLSESQQQNLKQYSEKVSF